LAGFLACFNAEIWAFKFLRFLRISLKFAEQFARKMQNLQILGAKFENFKRQI